MDIGIIIAIVAGVLFAILERQNSVPRYIIRDRTMMDDIIGNR